MESIKIFVLIVATLAPSYFSIPATCLDNHPCDLKDLSCVARFLKTNSACSAPVDGSIPPKFVIGTYSYDIPNFQGSATDRNLVVQNLSSCFLSEFSVDQKADKGIIGLDCPYLNIEEDREVRKHQSLASDIVYNYHITEQFPLIRITLVLPSVKTINLCAAETLTEVLGTQTYNIEPQDAASKAFLTSNPNYVTRFNTDIFYKRGVAMVRYFVQAYLCNFGCIVYGLEGKF